MKVQLECTYCGRVWEQEFYNQRQIDDASCRCGDSTLKVRDASKSKVDYYQGAPPFKKDDNDDDYWSGD